MNGQPIAILRAFEHVNPNNPSEARLLEEVLKQIKKGLQAYEIVVFEAGLKISDIQLAGFQCYELRLATNFTAWFNFCPSINVCASPSRVLC